jgi:hypothetical protein
MHSGDPDAVWQGHMATSVFDFGSEHHPKPANSDKYRVIWQVSMPPCDSFLVAGNVCSSNFFALSRKQEVSIWSSTRRDTMLYWKGRLLCRCSLALRMLFSGHLHLFIYVWPYELALHGPLRCYQQRRFWYVC